MKNYYAIIFLVYMLCSAAVFAQKKPVDLTSIKFKVTEAPEWSALLKRGKGWFGGDGIYTIPLSGNETRQAGPTDKVLFIFSDTMVGEIRDRTMVPGYKMIHNSAAILTGNEPEEKKMRFYWDVNNKGEAEALFTPHTPKTDIADYYWLGDGFVNTALGNSTYIFGYRVHNVSTDAFGFKEVGNTLIKIPAGSTPPYKNMQQMDTPFYLEGKDGNLGSFGTGIFVNTRQAGAPKPDGYIYVYGVRGINKEMMVSRVLPANFEKFDLWTFWDGKSWVSDISKVADVTDGVSNELSLTALPDGRYALVFQSGGMGTTVAMRIGESPKGPFGPVIKLWDTRTDLTKKTYVVYNAKGHPSLSKPGELLISYNINSIDFINDLMLDPNLYRPRFIRVKFE